MSKKIIDFDNKIKELEIFSEAQHKTILDLSRKLEKVEKEKQDLEMAYTNIQNASFSSSLEIPSVGTIVHNAQIIAEVQLSRLRQLSDNGPLSFEDSKKVELFVKVLEVFKAKEKTQPLQTINDDELLKIIESN